MKNLFSKFASLVFLISLFHVSTSYAQSQLPVATDETFVATSNTDSNIGVFQTVDFNFDIDITRFIGFADEDGFLNDSAVDQMIEDGLIPEFLILKVDAGDVDEPFIDIFINSDFFPDDVAVGRLTGSSQSFQINTFNIDIKKIRFPTNPGTSTSKPIPSQNTISVVIHDENPPGPNLGITIDWASLEFPTDPWRPVFLFHGFTGSPDAWDLWAARLGELGVDVYDPQLGPIGSLNDNSIQIETEINEAKNIHGVDQVIVVAHSKGGLDTRRYLQRTGNNDIKRFLMLGTPNSGTPLATLGTSISIIAQQKGYTIPETDNTFLPVQLTPKYMSSFNDIDRPSSNTSYFTYAGTYFAPNTTIPYLILYGGVNDTVVPVSSVHGLPQSYNPVHSQGGTTSIFPNQTAKHGLLNETNSVFDELKDFVLFGEQSGNPPSSSVSPIVASNQEINSSIGFSTGLQLAPREAAFARSAYNLSGAQQNTLPNTIHIDAHLIQQGVTNETSVYLEQSADTEFSLTNFNSDNSITLELVDPNGQTITETDAQTNPNIEFHDEDLSTGIIQSTFLITSPLIGTWTLRAIGTTISNTEGFYGTSVLTSTTDIQLSLSTDSPFYGNGDSIVILASLDDSGSPISSATINGTIRYPDSTHSALSFFDDGTNGDQTASDGVFTSTQTNTAQVGSYSLFVTGEWVNGETVKRTGYELVTVAGSSSSSLDGTYSESTSDSNADGLYDQLEIDVDISVDIAGEYAVSAQLESTSGTVITGHGAASSLSAGSGSITLSFSGEDIFNSELDGPYHVRSLVLSQETSEERLILDVIEDAYTTQSYQHNEFQRPNLIVTGPHSESTRDTDSDGEYNYLDVTVDIDFLTSDHYTVSLQLKDSMGSVIETVTYLTKHIGPIIPPGISTILIPFDGALIRDNGINGPFSLVNFTLTGESSATSLIIPNLGETQAYNHTDFEFETISTTVNVDDGWNMISVPVNTDDMSPSSVFPGAPLEAYTYIDGAGGWGTTGYTSVDQLETGRSYWMNFGSSTSYSVNGLADNTHTIPVIEGWNMIGPFESDILASSITSDPSGIIEPGTFFGWDNQYIDVSAGSLLVGKGYWVKTSQLGTLDLNQGASKGNFAYTSNTSRTQAYRSFPKLVFTDSRGNQRTLYVAHAPQIDSNTYELPPLPPDGLFDVRYQDNQYVKHLDKGPIQAEINGGLYPITIRFDNSEPTQIVLEDKKGFRKVLFSTTDNEAILTQPVQMLTIDRVETIPDGYYLDQNYPNPFSNFTTIEFGLPEPADISIEIYNVLGEKILEVASGHFLAGIQSIDLETDHLASGMYLLKIETSTGFSKARSMMLVR